MKGKATNAPPIPARDPPIPASTPTPKAPTFWGVEKTLVPDFGVDLQNRRVPDLKKVGVRDNEENMLAIMSGFKNH
jgi:hypothetical protein